MVFNVILLSLFWGVFLILQGRLKEGNKGFHVLRAFFKATINYPRQTRKLKGRQLHQIIS
jgi:hypothetical protein